MERPRFKLKEKISPAGSDMIIEYELSYLIFFLEFILDIVFTYKYIFLKDTKKEVQSVYLYT